jgi:hypothetical protein
MKERFRNLVDVPEKVAIGIGTGGLVLSMFYPPALGPSLLLIIGGGTSLGITNAVWPRKQTTA